VFNLNRPPWTESLKLLWQQFLGLFAKAPDKLNQLKTELKTELEPKNIKERKEVFGLPFPNRQGVIAAAIIAFVIVLLFFTIRLHLLGVILAPILAAAATLFIETGNPVRYRANYAMVIMVLVMAFEFLFAIPLSVIFSFF
jgi:hypothetical protein